VSLGPELDPGNAGTDDWIPPDLFTQQVDALIEPPAWSPVGPVFDPGAYQQPGTYTYDIPQLIEPPKFPDFVPLHTPMAAERNAMLQDALVTEYRPAMAAPLEGTPEFTQTQMDIAQPAPRVRVPLSIPAQQRFAQEASDWAEKQRNLEYLGGVGQRARDAQQSQIPPGLEGFMAATEFIADQWKAVGGGLITAGTPQAEIVSAAVASRLADEGIDPNSQMGYLRGNEIRNELNRQIFEEGARLEPGAGFLFEAANPVYFALPPVARLAAAPLRAAGVPGAGLIESAIANGGIPYIEKLVGLPFKAAAKALPAITRGIADFVSHPAVKEFIQIETGAGRAMARGLPDRLNAETLAQRIGAPVTAGQRGQNDILRAAILAREISRQLEADVVALPAFGRWMNDQAGESVVTAALNGTPEAVAVLSRRVDEALRAMRDRGEAVTVDRATSVQAIAFGAPVAAAVGGDEEITPAEGLGAAAIIAALSRGKVKPIIGRANAAQKKLVGQLAAAVNHKDAGALARSLARFESGQPVSKLAFDAFSKMDSEVREMIRKVGGAPTVAAATAAGATLAADEDQDNALGLLAIGALAAHQRGPALARLKGPAYNLLRTGITNRAAAGMTADQIAAHYQTSLEKVLRAAGVNPTGDRAKHLVDLFLKSTATPPAAALGPGGTVAAAAGAAPPAVLQKEGLLTSIWGALKSVKSTFDISHIGRQAVKLIPTHPVVAAGMLRDTFKALKDPNFWNTQVDAFKQSPDWARFVDGWGLYIADPNASARMLEEAFPTRIMQRAPLLDRFNAAYSAGLNSMRWNTMDSIVRGHEQGFISKARAALGASSATATSLATKKPITFVAISDDAGKGLARMVNVNSGRGYLGKAEGAALALNSVFFSPRYTVSTPEAIVDPLRALAERNPAVAFESAKSLVGFLTAGFATLKVAEAAGAEIEWLDPSSSEFLKIKFGDTRYDIWAGTQQTVVLFARLLTALVKPDTELADQWGISEWEGIPRDHFETITNWVQNKFHPGIETVAGTTALIGSEEGTAENRFDEVFGWVDVGGGAFVPITPMNILEAILDVSEGEKTAMEAAIDAGASIIGVGVNTYSEEGGEAPLSRLANKFLDRPSAAPTPTGAPAPKPAAPGGSKYDRR
jgi:hypothetical protein